MVDVGLSRMRFTFDNRRLDACDRTHVLRHHRRPDQPGANRNADRRRGDRPDPTGAFTDAFADLGLFESLMNMEFAE